MTLTLDEHAIANQKIAVGLVENACCWRLRDLAREVPADQAVVEIGAWRGRSTGWLALGAHQGHGARIHSIDVWEKRGQDTYSDAYKATARTIATYSDVETREAYEAHLERTGVRPLVTTHHDYAVNVAKTWTGPKVGLLWHDGDHELDAVTTDLRAWLPHMAETATIVLHDVGESRFGVQEGARRALARRKGWDWEGRSINLWAKQPHKRGYLEVHTVK